MSDDRKEVNNYNAVEVKFLPATSTMNNRIALINRRLEERVVLEYDDILCDMSKQAIAYINKLGIEVIGRGYLNKNSDVLFLKSINYSFQSIKEN